MNRLPEKFIQRRQQQGVVLVIALIMLLLMTIIGMSSMRTTTIEEMMAGAVRDKHIAFESAEVALRDAETFLTGSGLPNFGNTGGLYTSSGSGEDRWENVDWSASPCNCVSVSALGDGGTSQYIIEELPVGIIPGASMVVGFQAQSQAGMHQITARGAGKAGGVSILQSTYLR